MQLREWAALSFAILAAVFIQTADAYTEAALADQIFDLPGAEDLKITFNQFSGYLDIPGSKSETGKHMHYWFVESMNNPSTDPIAFWTNGGPGCSGLLGFLSEQGPFHPDVNNNLKENPYAWNKVANMIFIESPAGVGFSYADETADLTTGDAQTALDNYNLIQAFLERFPEYKNNDLYISSESYGGHYIPTLAREIVNQNKVAAPENVLNFKGFAVGNPYTDKYSGTPAMIDTYWGHQLVAKPTYDAYLADCVNAKVPKVRECAELVTTILNGVGNLNPYALDYPICLDGAKGNAGRAQRTWMLNHQLSAMGVDTSMIKNIGTTADYEPCEEDYTGVYLNQASVKKALHVDSSIRWQECSYKLKYNSTDSDVSTAPIYNELIDANLGLNLLVFSGDNDGVCGTIGTQNWIWDLGYEVAGNQWTSYDFEGTTSGYLTKFKDTKLAFLTVHGAGHEVPAYKPEVALDMWTRFLKGELTNA